jgi:hypothetical protein
VSYWEQVAWWLNHWWHALVAVVTDPYNVALLIAGFGTATLIFVPILWFSSRP